MKIHKLKKNIRNPIEKANLQAFINSILYTMSTSLLNLFNS